MIEPTTCPRCGLVLRPADDSDHSRPRPHSDPGAEQIPRSPLGTSTAAFSRPDENENENEVTIETEGASIALLGIDLGKPGPWMTPAHDARDPDRPSPAPSPADLELEGDEPEGRATGWPIVLLASYASAMTLACAWLWWTGHRAVGDRGLADRRPWANAPDAFPVDAPADPGLRADSSIPVEPVGPIEEGNRVDLGEAIRIDALEFTPLGVSSGTVPLHRTRVDGRAERRSGGEGALFLRLRLRNASDDQVFAPLDEAFVREPDLRLPETFIEDDAGGRVYAYRLPVASEWGISGQQFRALRPGESLETIIVSDTDARSRLDGPLTWRLRLRTEPESTAVVGVSFEKGQIEDRRWSWSSKSSKSKSKPKE